MRYALLIVLGLVIGIIGATMTLNAMHNKPDIPKSMMEMMGYYAGGLHKNVDANRCTASDNVPQLQAMRALSNDIEPVFLPVENEAHFRQRASNLRASLDAALSNPSTDCATLAKTLSNIGETCSGCHKEYRN